MTPLPPTVRTARGLYLITPEEPDTARLLARVAAVLPVGSDQFLEMEVEGSKLFLRLGKECRYREGDNASLTINANRLHLFDKQSTQSLLWA